MRRYLWLCLSVLFVGVMLTTVLPDLVSANDDGLLLLGIVGVMAMPPTLYFLYRKIFPISKDAL